MRLEEKRRLRNRANRSKLRSQIKKLRQAIADGDASKAQELLVPTTSLIDKSIQKGVIHGNAASRYKSRLTRQVSQLAG